MTINRAEIRHHLLEKVRARGLDKSVCPSEVARDLGGKSWRSLMEDVRSVGTELVDTEHIITTQKGQVVDPRIAKGPIRFRIKNFEGEAGG